MNERREPDGSLVNPNWKPGWDTDWNLNPVPLPIVPLPRHSATQPFKDFKIGLQQKVQRQTLR